MLKLISKFAYIGVLLAQLLIMIRFILKLVGANEDNFFSQWIFEKSSIILQPMKGLVQDDLVFWNFYIEMTSLVAILFLVVVSYILKEMIKTFSE